MPICWLNIQFWEHASGCLKIELRKLKTLLFNGSQGPPGGFPNLWLHQGSALGQT